MTGGPWTRSMKVVLGRSPNKSGAPKDVRNVSDGFLYAEAGLVNLELP